MTRIFSEDQVLKEANRRLSFPVPAATSDLVIFAQVHPLAASCIPLLSRYLANGSKLEACILSLDIRKSTTLMLNAKSPSAFAIFVQQFQAEMRSEVIQNFGIFDKFTGDGILSFFPSFYSGPSAHLLALRVAKKAQHVFQKHFQQTIQNFYSIPSGIGIGAGIDFGEVEVLDTGTCRTVVGVPVVYACRLASGASGTVLLNHNAQRLVFRDTQFAGESVDFQIKGGDSIKVFDFSTMPDCKAKDPDWIEKQPKEPS